MEKTNEKKQTGVRLEENSIAALKHIAIDLKRSYASLIQEAVNDFLKKHSAK